VGLCVLLLAGTGAGSYFLLHHLNKPKEPDLKDLQGAFETEFNKEFKDFQQQFKDLSSKDPVTPRDKSKTDKEDPNKDSKNKDVKKDDKSKDDKKDDKNKDVKNDDKKDPGPVKLPLVIAEGEWKEHNLDGTCTVLLPGTAKAEPFEFSEWEKGLKGQYLSVTRNEENASFLSGYLRRTLPSDKEFPFQAFCEHEQKKTIELIKGKLVKEQDLKLGSHTGKEFQIEVPGGGMLLERIFLVKDDPEVRIHIVSVAGPLVKPDAPAVAKYFGSLKLLKGEKVAVDPKKEDPKEKMGSGNDKAHALLKGKDNDIRCLVFSPDGKYLFSGTNNDGIFCWDVATLSLKSTIWAANGNKNLRALTISPDSKTLVVTTNRDGVQLIDVDTGNVKSTLVKSGETVLGIQRLDYSSAGNLLAAMAEDVRLWDVVTGKKLLTLTGHEPRPTGVAFSPDGKTIATIGHMDNRVKFWDPATGTELGSIQAEEEGKFGFSVDPRPMAFSRDGKRLAAGWGDKVRVFNVPTRKQRPELVYQKLDRKVDPKGKLYPRYPRGLAFSADADMLAVAYDEGDVVLWDVPTSQPRATLNAKGWTMAQGAVAFSPDGKKLVVGYGPDIQVWELERLSLEKVDPTKVVKDEEPDPKSPGVLLPTAVKALPAQVSAVLYSRDGKLLFAGSTEGTLKWWDATTLEEKGTVAPADPKRGLSGICPIEDSKVLVTITPRNLVDLVDLESKKVLVNLEKETMGMPAEQPFVVCSPDGKLLAAVVTGGGVRVWNVDTLKIHCVLKNEFNGDLGGVSVAAFLPDNKTLVTAIGNNTLRFWDTTTAKEVGKVKVNPDDKFDNQNGSAGMVVSADGRRLAFGWAGDSVRLFNVYGKKPRPPMKLETATKNGAASLALAPDGQLLAVGCKDATIQFWDIPTGKKRGLLKLAEFKSNPFDQHLWFVRSLAFSPDGKKLAIGFKEKVSLWDVEKLPLAKVEGEDVVQDDPVAFVPNKGARKQSIKDVAKIERFLGAGIDLEAKAILITLSDGSLKHYLFPALKAPRTYKLGGTAFRAVLDSKKKLLYALVDPKNKDLPPGQRPGDLHIYDVKDLLQEKVEAGSKLTPTKTILLGVAASHLILSPDGAALYYLDVGDEKKVKVGRVDTAKGERDETDLLEKTDCLCLTRDGKTLYAGSHVGKHDAYYMGPYKGAVQLINAATLKVEKTIEVAADPFDIEATDRGVVFLSSGSGQNTEVTVVDVKQAKPVVARWKGVYMNSCLKLSPDQQKLYVSTYQLSPATIACWHLPEKVAGTATPLATVCNPPSFTLRGELLVSPDGKFLLSEFGTLFQLKDAGPLVAETKPEDPLTKPKTPRNEIVEFAHNLKEKHLGAVVDVKSGGVLLTLPKGQMKHYSYPEFKLQATFKLAGTAYHPVLDSRQGLLYALVLSPKVLNPPGRGGDIVHVYEVKDILEGKADSAGLKPVRTIPVNGFASRLVLSPEGDVLYFLKRKDVKKPKVVRVDAAKGEVLGHLMLAEGTDNLCLTRDGKTLYAIAHPGVHSPTRLPPYQGTVQQIEAESLKLQKSVTVPTDAFGVDATDDGVVFVSGGSGQKADITVLDMNADKPVVARWKGFVSASCLRLSGDQKRLYVSSWRLSPGVVHSLRIPQKLEGSESPLGSSWKGVGPPGVRGEVVVSADGLHLLCDAGCVLALKEGKEGKPPPK
jgi:WD40 repeat protein